MKTYTAVLHLKNKEPQSVFQLAGRVSTNLKTNITVFSDPDPTLELFDTEIQKLNTAIKEKDGSKLKNEAIKDQTNVVYGMLKLLLSYTNKVANGDKVIILLSGFDCNNDTVSHDVPAKAVIKRVEDGSTLNSAKIYVEPLFDADRYKVEKATSLTEPINWITILDYGSLNKLEIGGIVRRQEIYLRVTGGNRHGWGFPSEPMMFFPR